VTLSKLLNDTALNSIEKRKEPKVLKFISQNRPTLVETVNNLLARTAFSFQLIGSPECKEHRTLLADNWQLSESTIDLC
jgi:hypothetical protein